MPFFTRLTARQVIRSQPLVAELCWLAVPSFPPRGKGDCNWARPVRWARLGDIARRKEFEFDANCHRVLGKTLDDESFCSFLVAVVDVVGVPVDNQKADLWSNPFC